MIIDLFNSKVRDLCHAESTESTEICSNYEMQLPYGFDMKITNNWDL